MSERLNMGDRMLRDSILVEERYCEIAARRLTQDVLDFGAIS